MKSITTLLNPLLAGARVKAVNKGQIILHEGDTPSEVFMIKSGIIKIHDIDEQGNEKILHLLQAGGLFPLAFFSGNDDPTRWFYTALTDVEMNVIPKQNLQKFMEQDGEVAVGLMNWFSCEVHELLVRLSSLGKTTTRDKLSAALLFLAVCMSENQDSQWRTIPFPVSHQVLADMTGVTRESAALVMKELQKDGYVRYPRPAVLEVNYGALANGQ